jgi:hypothetical protein
MHPETFEHHVAVHDYAEQNGLTYVWEGTAAFEKRKRLQSPEQYQIVAVHARSGVKQVLLFPRETARHDAVTGKRAQAWAQREARIKRVVEQHRSRDQPK